MDIVLPSLIFAALKKLDLVSPKSCPQRVSSNGGGACSLLGGGLAEI